LSLLEEIEVVVQELSKGDFGPGSCQPEPKLTEHGRFGDEWFDCWRLEE
jgi:hypothetical protein